MEFKIKIK